MLELLGYTAYLADGSEHHVHVRWADQLLAEREAPRHGITNAQPLHVTTYWVWAALKREGLYTGEFQQFLNVDVLGITPDSEQAEVPPTQPAQAG